MSAFKALNGTSPRIADAQTASATNITDAAVAAAATSPSERPQSASAFPRQTPTDVEAAPRRESWPTQGPEPAAVAAAAAGSSHSEGELSHKRKRSESAEASRREDTGDRTPDGASEHPHSDDREPYETPQREYRRYSEEHRDRERESWYTHQPRDERRPYDSQASATSTHGPGHPDELGSGLRHGTDDYHHGSPDEDDGDRSISMYHSSYGEHGRDSMLQHDPKKRKRNFSNRTKTGCLTCRKRKKKCDEHKPECTNCIKGGFVCAGYPPQRGAGWPKMDNKAAAVPLESKDPTYVPPGAYGMPQPAYPGQSSVKREPLPQFRRQSLRIDPPQGRPLVADGDRPPPPSLPSASVTSPENKLSAISYTPTNAFPTPVSANTQPPPFGERMGKDYQRVPPIHELGRPDSDSPMHSNHLPHINALHSGRTGSPASHPPSAHPPPPHSSSSSAQIAAQLALSHSSHSSQYGQRRTQKEEMLSGRHFYPFDKELCLERERCAAACWRFNNLTTPPTNGVSPEERARLFLEILQPRDPVRVSPAEASPVTNVGRVGRHVAVETPFTCDYGYNIIIGHQVVIGRNCTINDVCEVKIGDNSVIGPNVSIYTTSLPIDPKKRSGGQGPQFGRGITIEQDCWIGGGATILPGRTIGKGSTVGAGSIVTKDVPPFTVVAGNPARVLRGIAS